MQLREREKDGLSFLGPQPLVAHHSATGPHSDMPSLCHRVHVERPQVDQHFCLENAVLASEPEHEVPLAIIKNRQNNISKTLCHQNELLYLHIVKHLNSLLVHKRKNELFCFKNLYLCLQQWWTGNFCPTLGPLMEKSWIKI